MGPGGVMPPMPRWLSGLLATVVLVAAVSGLLVLVEPHAPALSLSVLYLLAVVPVAIVWGVRQAMVASLLSTTAFAYLFLPPQRSLEVYESQSLLDAVMEIPLDAAPGLVSGGDHPGAGGGQGRAALRIGDRRSHQLGEGRHL